MNENNILTFTSERSRIRHVAKLKFALGLILLLSLLSSVFAVTPVYASTDEVKWLRVNIPMEGRSGNWVLADGADVRHLTMAGDGTLYCFANPTGASRTLFKSTDGGYSWSSTGGVGDNIVDIAIAPDNAGLVYYATSSKVYKSTDAGNTYVSLTPDPAGAGSNNVAITSIDVTSVASGSVVAVGTKDTDNAQYGGVYILYEGESSTWTDTNLGSYDVYAVALSPDFVVDRQLIAIVTDETDTIVTAKAGNAGWGETVGSATITGLVPVSAAIALPVDYNSEVTSERYVQFVALNTGSGDGDVYKIDGKVPPTSSEVTDLNIGSSYGLSSVDVTDLAISGSAAGADLMAGAASSAQIYFSTDGGTSWTPSTKQPTGVSKTYVLVVPDFSSSGKAYAATSGTESAFSISWDGGITWDQIGLIDTGISTIVDMAVSPNYSLDSTLFLLTYGGEYSLWRSLNGGARWERVYSSALASVDQIDLVELSPQYDSSQVVFIAGTGNSNSVIWESSDNGQSFLRLSANDPTTGTSLTIDTWAVASDETIFVGSFDGSNGLVYRTINSGRWYSTGAVAGAQSLNSVLLSPSYEQDETVLVGNTNGWVYWSNDNGASFEPLPSDATSPPLTGSISVAFDSQFSSNKTVYAASDTADKGIYRFIIGSSTSWEGIDGTLPSGAKVSEVVVSAEGVLYATNFKADGGMERCLNPTYSLGPTFETVTRGLDDSATLIGLRLCGSRLWAIDSTKVKLLTYIDSLTLPVTLTSPSDQAQGIGTILNYNINNVKLDWETLSGATSYKWQLDYDTDFSSIPTGFEGSTGASSARLPTLEPATIYYWRVRAIQPVLSPWSAKWSFTTSLGSETTALNLESPKAGAIEVPLKPLFEWSTMPGADSYELLVSSDVSFTNPVIVKIDDHALPATAWQCDIALNYDITYYWKVRACNVETHSTWSAVGAFTTKSSPELEPAPSPQPPPVPPQPSPSSSPAQSMQQIIPDWVMFMIGGLFLTIVLLLVMILVLVVKVRHL
jgi:hypothetical protein